MKPSVKRSRILWVSLALIGVAFYAWQALKPKQALPTPARYPRTADDIDADFSRIEQWRDTHPVQVPLVFGRVLTENNAPSWFYDTLHRRVPVSRHWLHKPPGKIRVLETLCGTNVTSVLSMPQDTHGTNTPIKYLENTESDIIMTVRLQRGEYWLLAPKSTPYNNLTGLPLTGPNDPILIALRRSVAWERMSNRAQILQETQAMLNDPNAAVLDRIAALDTLRWAYGQPRCTRPIVNFFTAHDFRAEHAALQHSELARIITKTLALPHLPFRLRCHLIRSCWPAVDQPLAANSNDTQQLHYLLETITHSHNYDAVNTANFQLEDLMEQPSQKRLAVNYFRAINGILLRREAADIRQQHPVNYDLDKSNPPLFLAQCDCPLVPDALEWYAHAPIKPIPAIGTDTRSQELMAAAKN